MFKALGFYYIFKSGIAFVSQSKLATFTSKMDAITFKQAYPTFTVLYAKV